MAIELHNVQQVKATLEEGVFLVFCNITDSHGDTYDAVHGYRPEDEAGLGPLIKQWFEDNPDHEVTPYTEPTPEEARANLPDLTARQLRLALLGNAITMSQVTTAILDIPDVIDRDKALVEWEYASNFARAHPLIATVGAALGLTDEQIDTMWVAALSL